MSMRSSRVFREPPPRYAPPSTPGLADDLEIPDNTGQHRPAEWSTFSSRSGAVFGSCHRLEWRWESALMPGGVSIKPRSARTIRHTPVACEQSLQCGAASLRTGAVSSRLEPHVRRSIAPSLRVALTLSPPTSCITSLLAHATNTTMGCDNVRTLGHKPQHPSGVNRNTPSGVRSWRAGSDIRSLLATTPRVVP